MRASHAFIARVTCAHLKGKMRAPNDVTFSHLLFDCIALYSVNSEFTERYGNTAKREYGEMGIWRNGNMAKWEYGEMGIWRNGNIAKWEDTVHPHIISLNKTIAE
jgi:hypothetical protein